MTVNYIIVIIGFACCTIVVACKMTVERRCVVIMSVVTSIVVIRAVVVVMISPPRVSVVGFAPNRIVIRVSPSETPIGAVIRVSETPIPIVVPRVGNHYVVVSSATIRTVKTVDTSGITVINHYYVGVVVISVGIVVYIYIVVSGKVAVRVGVFVSVGLRLSIRRGGNGLLFCRVAVNVVAAGVGARSVENRARTEHCHYNKCGGSS